MRAQFGVKETNAVVDVSTLHLKVLQETGNLSQRQEQIHKYLLEATRKNFL